MAVAGHGLGDLTLMVGEFQVDAAAMDVKLLAEVFLAHRGAFQMPAGETVAPGGWPAHDMLGRGLFPEGEVGGVALLGLAVEGAGLAEELLHIASRELAVMVFGVVSRHIEVDRPVALIGQPRVENLLDILDLLDDMARGVGLDRWGKHIEPLHGLVIAVEIVLHNLHRLQLFEAGLLGDFVLTLVGVMLEMAHVGDVADIADLVAEPTEVAVEDIECDGRTRVAQMAVAVDSRAADIHAHAPLVDGTEEFLVSRK